MTCSNCCKAEAVGVYIWGNVYMVVCQACDYLIENTLNERMKESE
jgi:hypothetical protein